MRHSATRAVLSRARRDHRRVGVVHLRHRRSQLLPRAGHRPRGRAGAAARRAAAPARRPAVRAQRHRLSPRHLPRARRHRRDLRRRTRRRRRCASSSSATRSRPISRDRSAARQGQGQGQDGAHLPRVALRDAGERSWCSAIDAIKVELRERLQELSANMKLVEKQRLEQRTMFDLEMLEQMGHCNGIENYSRHLSGRTRRRAAADADRLFPEGLFAVRRRVAPDGAAGAVDVPRRSLAQGDAGRVRLPPAVGARQPAAQVRGVGAARRPGRSTCRRRRATTSSRSPRAWSSSR